MTCSKKSPNFCHTVFGIIMVALTHLIWRNLLEYYKKFSNLKILLLRTLAWQPCNTGTAFIWKYCHHLSERKSIFVKGQNHDSVFTFLDYIHTHLDFGPQRKEKICFKLRCHVRFTHAYSLQCSVFFVITIAMTRKTSFCAKTHA
jgi:hypothetical protein